MVALLLGMMCPRQMGIAVHLSVSEHSKQVSKTLGSPPVCGCWLLVARRKASDLLEG